jgi:hypothetical protein
VWDGCCHHLAGSLIFYNDVCDSDFGMIFLVLQQEKERAMVNEMGKAYKCMLGQMHHKFTGEQVQLK